MNETVKQYTPAKQETPGLSLDHALAVIEKADGAIKKAVEVRDGKKYEGESPRSYLNRAAINRVSYLAAAFSSGSFLVILSACLASGSPAEVAGLFPIAFTPMVVSVPMMAVISKNPFKWAKILARKKHDACLKDIEIVERYAQIAQEEFAGKEKKILSQTKKALKAANRQLAVQGSKIVYNKTTGQERFVIESSSPINLSKWDKLRLEAIRHTGLDALDIAPERKALEK